MKKSILFFSLMLAFLGLSAQEKMEPEVVFKGSARIIMADGEVLEGEASYSCINVNRIRFTPADSKTESLRIKNVQEFFIDDMHFVKLQTPGISIGSNDQVARRLNPEGRKISLYEVITQGSIGTGDGSGGFVYKTHSTVYIQSPDMKSPRAINDLAFSPFHKKVSKLVSDCKELSKKIANKEDGYKVSMITPPEMKLELLLRIAEEFEACK